MKSFVPSTDEARCCFTSRNRCVYCSTWYGCWQEIILNFYHMSTYKFCCFSFGYRGPKWLDHYLQSPLGVHVHIRHQWSRQCHKPDKKLEKILDPPIINSIIGEKKFSNFCCIIRSQMHPQSPLVGLNAHTHALGRRWYDKPNKNLEKNSDPPIINPIIREKKVL